MPRSILCEASQALKGPLARGVGFVLNYSGLLPLYEYLRPEPAEARIFVLMYHRITDSHSSCHTLCVSPSNFHDQMNYLSTGRLRVVSLDTLHRYVQHEEDLHGDVVLVTFDDGYRDVYTTAFPILQEFGIPATVFLSTGMIDSRIVPWWDRVTAIVLHLHHTGHVLPYIHPGIPPSIWQRLRRAVAGALES